MIFFIYGRDRPDTVELRDRTTEAHWSFMDGYAEGMIARGPTLTPDGTAATGSMHIVDLPDREAARAFAFDVVGLAPQPRGQVGEAAAPAGAAEIGARVLVGEAGVHRGQVTLGE